MANRKLNARQQQKHDTSSGFNSKNATYLEAEILVESDTGRVKIGDGDTDYKTLPYTIGTRVPTDAKFTDTTYTNGTGLSLSGTTFSITNTGVTADDYGPTGNVTGSFGTPVLVPSITVNSRGQITSATNRTVTMPAKPTATDIGAEPAFTKNTAFNKNFGTAAGTVCEGDDERLSNARPASDVSAWAKAATKPTYTPTEVGVIGTAPTSGQVAVFDGTTGKIKSTGFTIATSVPADAKFTDTTYSVFDAATTSSAGGIGLVPAPSAGQSTRYLCSNGEWSIPAGTVYNGSTTISVKPSTTDGEYNIYLVALYGRITALANRSMILSGALASGSAPGLCPKLDSAHPSYYLNANGSWSLPRGRVYGVKGEAETDYREGQVNITAANVGALALTGGTVSGSTTFSNNVTINGELNYDGGFY